jgi:hypothetical protein
MVSNCEGGQGPTWTIESQMKMMMMILICLSVPEVLVVSSFFCYLSR